MSESTKVIEGVIVPLLTPVDGQERVERPPQRLDDSVGYKVLLLGYKVRLLGKKVLLLLIDSAC